MTAAWDDPRIVEGMRQELQWRRQLLVAGNKALGWKLAFGGPAAMQRLRINAPLVGFLMEDALLPSGAAIPITNWIKPAAEPELTVYMAKDLEPAADRQTTAAAIEGLGAAIEVADVDHPSEDIEGTLARNIYQRHLILSGCDCSHAGGSLAGLRAQVEKNGALMADTTDFEVLTGELIAIVSHVASLLWFFGEKLRAGQIIIAGSITPPIWVRAGETIRFKLQPLEPIAVTFVD